jgi:hypothetical protein
MGLALDSIRYSEPDCRWRRGRLIPHSAPVPRPMSDKPASRIPPKPISFQVPPSNIRPVNSRSSIGAMHGVSQRVTRPQVTTLVTG